MRKFWLPLAMSLLLSGCGAVRINRILNDPARYHNRDVKVDGRVTRSLGAFVTGFYQVDDGTGTIYVISNGGVPRSGSHVSVKGRVMNGLTVGTRSFGTAIREQTHHVH